MSEAEAGIRSLWSNDTCTDQYTLASTAPCVFIKKKKKRNARKRQATEDSINDTGESAVKRGKVERKGLITASTKYVHGDHCMLTLFQGEGRRRGA